MGPNMVHCDTMDMTPPASPSPAYAPDYQGQRLLGQALVTMIFGDREKALRMRIGKLIADGDCQGATRLALESGQLELGRSISETCRSQQQGVALAQPTGSHLEQAPSSPPTHDSCTPDKIRYARSIGVDCHSLGARFPQE
jgi:hypothetical protein